MRRPVIKAGLFIVCAALSADCARASRTAPTRVLVITLDTTRADRLAPYGFMDVATPHLDRLAREGVVFDQATSVAPLTLPAHASLFTGMLPPRHGVRDNGDRPLAAAQVTLAEILQARGYRTAAFVGSVVLDPERGLAQGFDRYSRVSDAVGNRPELLQRNARSVVDDALGWLNGVGESPFFLWVHLYDPHRPYAAPEPFASRYAHDPYLAEIAFADDQIGRLLAAIDHQHLSDRTVVVVAGDHGESLGEHGEEDHGVFLYDSVLRVPLIVRTPGAAPRRVAAGVRLTDVMPTILDVLGLPIPSLDGVSLIGTGQDVELEAYSESSYPEQFGWSGLRALRSGRFKFIAAPRPELYDLARDPHEERNLFHERPQLAAALQRRLRAISQGDGAGRAGGAGGAGRLAIRVIPDQTNQTNQTPADDPALRARLAALGYVASGPRRSAGEEGGLPDPKDCPGVYRSGRCQ